GCRMSAAVRPGRNRESWRSAGPMRSGVPLRAGFGPGWSTLDARIKSTTQLAPRGDLQLRENSAQVPFDGSRADEQTECDLGVGEAFAGQPSDVDLLGREFGSGVRRALAYGFAGSRKFSRGALGEGLRTHRRKDVMRDSQLFACVGATVFAAQPLAVLQA